jgi:GPI inositol-deacylase
VVVSMCLIFLLIFLLVPWQVAFLGCWVVHLYTCATSTTTLLSSSEPRHSTPNSPNSVTGPSNREADEVAVRERLRKPLRGANDNRNHNMHILLLMTWLIPLASPVLFVWVKTAGLTSPLDGNHNFLNVAPFLVLVDYASRTAGQLFERQR